MELCSVPSCDRPIHQQTRRLCKAHDQRFRAYGDVRADVPIRLRNASLEDLFWQKVDRRSDSECWEWKGRRTKQGYGQAYAKAGSKIKIAHRLAYELLVGPIPAGLTLDHLCRNKACVNPLHLEPVTRAENKRRASRLQTHCVNGHQLSGDNIYSNRTSRVCKTCARERAIVWNRNNKDRIAARGPRRR